MAELKIFVLKAQKLITTACFNLRGWEGNVVSPFLSKSTGDTSVLGLIWNLDQDTLRCSIPKSIDRDQHVTKRNVLSLVQQIFDPMGWVSPATLYPKIQLQVAWRQKLSWDQSLSLEAQKDFLRWMKETEFLNALRVPRYVKVNGNSELHVFVDACKSAYGTCIFMRTEKPEVQIQLVRAKARVAPIKDLTIPKLELMACCIGARLAHSIKLALDSPDIKVTYWSDSMTSLWWIKNYGEWSVFVSNTVKEMRQLSKAEDWFHIPGSQNPADLVSRGCFPKQLIESQWWNGPSWMYQNKEDWPSGEIFYEKEVESERRKVRLNHVNISEENTTPWYAIKFSNYESIIRLVAWILRFVKNSQAKRDCRKTCFFMTRIRLNKE